MPNLMHRAIRVTATPLGGGTGVVIEDVNVEFTIERSLAKEPNTITAKLFNLSRDTVGILRDGDDIELTLEAGYGTRLETLFVGNLRDVTQELDGPNVVTVIEAGDGEKASKVWVNKRFNKNTKLESVFHSLATSALLNSNLSKIRRTLQTAGRTSYFKIPRTLKKGMTVRGYAVDELFALAQSYQLEFSIQDNAFRLTIDEEKNGTLPKLTPETGLIGSPVVTKKGEVSGECVMVPGMFPGVGVRIESRFVTGEFRITKTTHAGSKFGGDFTINFEGKETK